jgi:hypothetical protein
MARPRLLLFVALAGCPADDGSSDAETTGDPTTGGTTDASDGSSSSGMLPDVDYEMDIQPLMNANCTCHLQGASGTMTAPFMTLNPGISHGEIVGVASMQSDLVRVAPGDLEASYLWHKLEGTHLDVGGMGTAMPPTTPLQAADRELVRAWILQGALP